MRNNCQPDSARLCHAAAGTLGTGAGPALSSRYRSSAITLAKGSACRCCTVM